MVRTPANCRDGPCAGAGRQPRRSVMIVKIYPGDDGKSHFEPVDQKEWQTDWEVDPAKGPINFRCRDPGYFNDLHNASRRQYVITLSGQVDVGIGNGSSLRFGPGDLIFASDLTGEGHSTKTVGDEPWVYCAIPSD